LLQRGAVAHPIEHCALNLGSMDAWRVAPLFVVVVVRTAVW
jgi:hypothetical protein